MANKDKKIVGMKNGMIWSPKHALNNYALGQEKQEQHYLMQNLQAQHQCHNSNSDHEIQRVRLSSPTFEQSGEQSNKAQVETVILDPTKEPRNGTGVFIPKLHKASSRRRRKLAGRNAYHNIKRGRDNLDNENDNHRGTNDEELHKLDSPGIQLPEEWSYDVYG